MTIGAKPDTIRWPTQRRNDMNELVLVLLVAAFFGILAWIELTDESP